MTDINHSFFFRKVSFTKNNINTFYLNWIEQLVIFVWFSKEFFGKMLSVMLCYFCDRIVGVEKVSLRSRHTIYNE